MEQAQKAEATPFARAQAMAVLIVRLQRWLEEFASFANERGATDGLDTEGFLDLARQLDALPAGSHSAIEVRDGRAHVRPLSEEEEREALEAVRRLKARTPE